MRSHHRLAVSALGAGAVCVGLIAPAIATPAAPSTPSSAVSSTTTALSTSIPAQAAPASARTVTAKVVTTVSKPAPRTTAASRYAARATMMRASAVKIALAKVRQHPQYVAGGRGPRTFDCAGFTWWVWHRAGRNIPDNTWGQRSALKRISKSQAKAGDIVLYMNGAHHSELYLGRGRTVGCSNSRTDCKVKRLSGWYARHFSGFYRVV